MDSIYAYDDASLYVNLFTPSRLDWAQRNITVTQTTDFPVGGELATAPSPLGTTHTNTSPPSLLPLPLPLPLSHTNTSFLRPFSLQKNINYTNRGFAK